MPFDVVNGVVRGMDVLDGVKGAVLGVNSGRPIVTDEEFVA